MSRFLTARNAAILSISGAILWLSRVPSIELGPFEAADGSVSFDVVSMTTSGTAIVGLAAIALGIALHGVVNQRRSSAAAAVLMVAGLAMGYLAFLNQADFLQLTFVGAALASTAWFVIAVAERSPAALLAAVALVVHGLGAVPGSPLAMSFGIREVAPAVFGLAALVFLGLRALEGDPLANSERALAA